MSRDSQAAIVQVLDDFCSAFARRDGKAVMDLFADDPDIVIVTSEETVVRGLDELETFLRAYARGATTYSWSWREHHVVIRDRWAWLVAHGHETASSDDGQATHPYRMTMVLQHPNERWLLVHAHGSSPHAGSEPHRT